jgi:hypothetical protein
MLAAIILIAAWHGHGLAAVREWADGIGNGHRSQVLTDAQVHLTGLAGGQSAGKGLSVAGAGDHYEGLATEAALLWWHQRFGDRWMSYSGEDRASRSGHAGLGCSTRLR